MMCIVLINIKFIKTQVLYGTISESLILCLFFIFMSGYGELTIGGSIKKGRYFIDKHGFDKEGIHKDTHTYFDLYGFNKYGIHQSTRGSLNRYGFNIDHYHKDTGEKYNKDGFNIDLCHKITGTKYGPDGYDINGYNEKGYDRDGYDREGYNEKGYDRDGYDKEGYNEKGYDRDGYDKEGYNKNGYDREGYDREGYNKNGYDREGYDKEGYDESGRNKHQKDKLGYSCLDFYKVKAKIENSLHHQNVNEILMLLNDWSNCFMLHNEYGLLKKIKENTKQILVSYLTEMNYIKADQFFLEYGRRLDYSYEDYIKLKKNSIKKFFNKNNRDPNEINDEKYNILADFSQYLLVKARAGTGKTTALKYKTWFLNKAYGINPDEILVLAFNKKAAEEIGDRIRNMKVGGFRTAFTFHSLAGKILSRKKDREVEDVLFDNDKNNDPILSQFVQSIFRDFSEEEKDEMFAKLYDFFRKELDELEENHSFLNPEEYYDYIKGQTQVTLSGITVKSKYEKRIADFLFEYGIDFSYEWRYDFSDRNQKGENINRPYRPDFRLNQFITDPISNYPGLSQIKNEHVFIEFRGVLNPEIADPKLKPQHLTEKAYMEYIDAIKRKRKKMKEDKRLGELIELNLREGKWGREFLEQRLKEELEKRGIICRKLPTEELIKKVKDKHIKAFTDKIVKFINKAKQNKLTVEKVKQIDQTQKFSDKLTIYYEFAIDIYERYQKKLKESKKQDFNDLLWEATEYINEENGNIAIKLDTNIYQNLNNFKYILIDEYQDFSLLFREIISSLKKWNPKVKCICVGDDWQLINSFAGSNIKYIQNFTDFFPGGRQLTLLTSNRCPKNILDISNDFMQGKGEPAQWNKKRQGEIKGQYLESLLCKIDYQYDKETNNWYVKDKKYALALGWGILMDKQYTRENLGKYYIVDKRKVNQDLTLMIFQIVNILVSEKIYESNLDVNNKNTFKEEDLKACALLIRKNNLYNCDEIENIKKIIFETRFYSSFNQTDINNETKKIIKENFFKCFFIQTIHKSKGQEYDVVILPKIGSSDYPFIHPDTELDEIFGTTIQDVFEEEQRLFYVALTRSKDKLYYIVEGDGQDVLDGKKLLSLWNSYDSGGADGFTSNNKAKYDFTEDLKIFETIKENPVQIENNDHGGVIKNENHIIDTYQKGYLTLVNERNYLQKSLSDIIEKNAIERENLLQQVKVYEENNKILKDNLSQVQEELLKLREESYKAKDLITATNANNEANQKLSKKLEEVLEELGRLQEESKKKEKEKKILQEELQIQKEKLENITNENRILKNKLKEAEDKLQNYETQYTNISLELEQAKKDGNKNLISKMEKEKEEIEMELDKIRKEKETLVQELQGKDKEVEKIQKIMNDMNEEILIKAGEMDKAEKEVLKLIKKAQRIIILIDPYIDKKTFYYLGQRKIGVKAKLHYANRIDSGILALKNDQEENAIIVRHHEKDFHDRYLILDNHSVYHFGASMDSHLGEKQTMIKKLSSTPQELMESLGFNI